MTKKKADITLDIEVINKIDNDRGDIPRSTYINNILKRTLKINVPRTGQKGG